MAQRGQVAVLHDLQLRAVAAPHAPAPATQALHPRCPHCGPGRRSRTQRSRGPQPEYRAPSARTEEVRGVRGAAGQGPIAGHSELRLDERRSSPTHHDHVRVRRRHAGHSAQGALALLGEDLRSRRGGGDAGPARPNCGTRRAWELAGRSLVPWRRTCTLRPRPAGLATEGAWRTGAQVLFTAVLDKGRDDGERGRRKARSSSLAPRAPPVHPPSRGAGRSALAAAEGLHRACQAQRVQSADGRAMACTTRRYRPPTAKPPKPPAGASAAKCPSPGRCPAAFAHPIARARSAIRSKQHQRCRPRCGLLRPSRRPAPRARACPCALRPW